MAKTSLFGPENFPTLHFKFLGVLFASIEGR